MKNYLKKPLKMIKLVYLKYLYKEDDDKKNINEII